MAQIGHFSRTPSGYTGRVRTLSLDLELTFVPAENADVENAPDYRIHPGDEDGPEIGAGWKHTGERAGAFISSCSTILFFHSLFARVYSSRTKGGVIGACTGRA